ncbi:winged helix-turn-helix transcriptional regulator [Altererythrobacter sp. MF3-039]|uniref:winged helix-turn-helix transcriptional regulator n=1 Tax=Altererythrobacter sp. MF3-039 TaxID=3252901 RepID=UPI00390CD0E4
MAKAQVTSHCPATKAAELLGDKWTLLILRAMMLGASRYSDFNVAIPNISPSVLSGRLKQVCENGLVTKRGGTGQQASYHLTPSGRECRPLIFFLGRWGLKWAQRNIRDERVDVAGAMWDFHRTLNLTELPDGETVFAFTLTDVEDHGKWWVVAQGETVDLCNYDPGKDVNLYIHAPLELLIEIWMAECSVDTALREERMTLTGDSQLLRTASLWFPLSPMKAEERQAA